MKAFSCMRSAAISPHYVLTMDYPLTFQTVDMPQTERGIRANSLIMPKLGDFR